MPFRLSNILFLLTFAILFSCKSSVDNFSNIDRLPSIFPDYTGILVPSNIAPINFKINEQGKAFEVKIYTEKSDPITIRSNDGSIRIDESKWHKLLEKHAGSKLFIDVFVEGSDGRWQKFKTIENEISSESIDEYLAYRLINTGYELWNNLGIYQRNLTNFDEEPIIENKTVEYGCMNCHSFASNKPENFMLHIRAVHGGTVVLQNGKLSKIDTKTKFTLATGAYPNWHPDGKHIAYSVNNIGQFFCSGEVRIEVADKFSDLIVYNVEKNTVSTAPQVSTDSRENLPVWSPDGKYIYFISTSSGEEVNQRILGKYDLLRVAFDPATDRWGKVDTVLASREIGETISFPKVSPNGKFLMFCTSDNGYFTIHHPKTDLAMLNLQTGEKWKMDINSPETDSYHCFSSKGHWFVFSSKRMDGLFTRPYFSYLDENGKATKPFVLPQEDPEFYKSFIKNYNIPELITGKVPVSPVELRDKILDPAIPAKIDASVDTVYMRRHLSKAVN